MKRRFALLLVSFLIALASMQGCSGGDQSKAETDKEDVKEKNQSTSDSEEINHEVRYQPDAPFPTDLNYEWERVGFRDGKYVRLISEYGSPISRVLFKNSKHEWDFWYDYPNNHYRLAAAVNVDRIKEGYHLRIYYEYSHFEEAIMRDLDHEKRIMEFDFRTDVYSFRKDTMVAVHGPYYRRMDSLIFEESDD